MTTVLITGASSGIGEAFARKFAKKGYRLILVGRSREKLMKIASELKTRVRIVPMDLSVQGNCERLYSLTKNVRIDILINNAGFGEFGEFTKTSLENELNMIDLNVKALHILTKLYLRDFTRRNSGYIMNVASIAAFAEGPLMAAYYATKAYVVKLTNAIRAELKAKSSKVRVCSLCPGPVDTGFNERAGVCFSIGQMSADEVVREAIVMMYLGFGIIVPGFSSKLIYLFSRFLPTDILAFICYHVQNAKN